MADLKPRFEKELKFKIGQKSKDTRTEEALLVKSFKYFDLDDSGAVSKGEFQKAIQKIGVTSFEKPELDKIFDLYDTNRDGELDYREFSAIIFGSAPITEQSQQSLPERPSTSQTRYADTQQDDIINTIKKRIIDKGAIGLIGLAKAFRLADKYQDKKIEFNEFYAILDDYHLGINFKQAETVFNSLNKSGSGLVNYEDFLTLFKGRLSAQKRTAITQAFHKLDIDRDGMVDISELKRSFDGSRHPEVIRGNKTEGDVMREFLNVFDSFIAYRKIRGVALTAEEFEDMYAFIAASFEDEQRFLTMMSNVWKINQTPEYLENKPLTQRTSYKNANEEAKYDRYGSLEDVQQNLTYIIQRFRQRLALKGIKGYVGLYRAFRNVDHDDDGVITSKEFVRILRDIKMEIPEQDAQYIFAHYDKNRNGQISFDDFMVRVLGSLTFERREIVDAAWRKLDVSENGKVQISTIQGLLKDLRNHPDVKSGRKSQEQVAREFIEVLDFHHNEIVRSSSTFLNRREFDEFILYLSVIVSDDKYFEAIVHTVFKLETERNYQDNYAGAGRKDYDPRGGYLKDFHRSALNGGTVSMNAPFGTDLQNQNQAFNGGSGSKPIVPNFDDDTQSSKKGSQYHYSPSKAYPDIYSNRDDQSERRSYSETDSRVSVDGEDFEEIKKKILGRGLRGLLGIIKSLRLLDHDKLKNLPVNSFLKALNDYRLDIDEERTRFILEGYKLIQNGRVEYEKFLKLVKGEMSQTRRKTVTHAYERINADRKGYVTIDDIKDIFDPRQHPDVRSHRRDQDDIALEHVETIDLHHMLFTTSVKGKDIRVSQEEFVDYYEHVSCLIDNDSKFDQLLTNCWKTYPTSNPKDAKKDESTYSTTSRQSQRGVYVGKY